MVDSLYQGAVTGGNSTHSAIMSSSEYLSQVRVTHSRSHISSGSVMHPQHVCARRCRTIVLSCNSGDDLCTSKLSAVAQLHDITELLCRLAAT